MDESIEKLRADQSKVAKAAMDIAAVWSSKRGIKKAEAALLLLDIMSRGYVYAFEKDGEVHWWFNNGRVERNRLDDLDPSNLTLYKTDWNNARKN